MTHQHPTSPNRRLLQMSIRPDLYEQIKEHCHQLDVPMAVWARDVIRRELAQHLEPPA